MTVTRDALVMSRNSRMLLSIGTSLAVQEFKVLGHGADAALRWQPAQRASSPAGILDSTETLPGHPRCDMAEGCCWLMHYCAVLAPRAIWLICRTNLRTKPPALESKTAEPSQGQS